MFISYDGLLLLLLLLLLLHAIPAKRGKVRPADRKAAKFLPLVGLARSKQDPVNRRGHGSQYLYRPPPAGGPLVAIIIIIIITRLSKPQ